MKQEKLFTALTDVGDDLLEMAQTRRFSNPWKRWGRLAACLAAVVCLAALALPYFPMGCGSSEAPDYAYSSDTTEAPAEGLPDMKTETETAVEEPAACPEERPEESCDSAGGQTQNAEGQVTVWFRETAYVLQGDVLAAPEDLGGELGTVERAEGRDLTGCAVYAASQSEDIYVQLPEGFQRCGKQP